MKSISLFLSIAFLLFTLVSCEEVIEVNRRAEQSQIAVEGVILNRAGESYVRLSNTTSYFAGEAPAAVQNAIVTVRDHNGNTVSFEETEDGRYIAPENFLGMPGHTYFLTVSSNGHVLTAQSTMPDSMQIMNVRLQYVANDDPYMQEGFYLYGTLNADRSDSDYFQSEPYINGVRQQKDAGDLQIFDNRFFEGLGNVEGMFAHWSTGEHADVQLKEDDVIEIRLYTLDKPAYDYLKALKDTPSQGGMYGKNPANVPSNISGGVGLFHAAACTISEPLVVHQ